MDVIQIPRSRALGVFLASLWDEWLLRFLVVGLSSLDEHLVVNSRLSVAMFQPLPGEDSSLVEINLEQSQPAHVFVVASVAAKANTASITHP